VRCRALKDAIKTDSNLITREVAITEKNRDCELWHYIKHTGIFCVCLVVPVTVSNFIEKKSLYNLEKMPFPG